MSDDTYFFTIRSDCAKQGVFGTSNVSVLVLYIYTYVVAIWFKRTYDVGVYCVIEILILSWKKKVLIPLNTY